MHGRSSAAVPEGQPGLRVFRIGTGGDFQDPDDALGTVYGLADGDLLLIRPGGYVGAIVAAAGSGRIAAYLADVLGQKSPTAGAIPKVR